MAEKLLTFNESCTLLGGSPSISILPNMTTNNTSSRQSVYLVPADIHGTHFGASTGAPSTSQLVQLLPYYTYEWSGPKVYMISKYFRGIGTGSVVNTDSATTLNDSDACYILEKGSKFKINSTYSGKWLTYFKCASGSVTSAALIFYNSATKKDDPTKLVTKTQLQNSLYPGLFNCSASNNTKCIKNSDLTVIKNTKYENNISIQLNNGSSSGMSTYVFAMPDDVFYAKSVNIEKSESGQEIPTFLKFDTLGSGSLISKISLKNGSIIASGTSWSGYYVLTDAKGMNGVSKGTIKIPLHIGFNN